MKILITGISGTGKSTISNELKKRGFAAVDFSDIPDLRYWRTKATKEKVTYSPVRDETWFDLHERICDIERLRQILGQYEDVIISGLATGNMDEVVPLFDRVVLLQCNPETFVHRMKTREHPYGKTEAERNRMLEFQQTFEQKLLSLGAIPVSTEGTITDSVEAVIAHIS